MTIHFNDCSEHVAATSVDHEIDRPFPNTFYTRYAKRAIDVAAVVLTAIITAPIVLFFAALVALDGHNPFYRQTRVGLGGREFGLWKLRSMKIDADDCLESHLADNPACRAEWDETQKLKSDPRITRLGHFIRKSSIDELPQLWNVLKGDMSLVGPRPFMVCQKDMYHGQSYYKLRPGISGLWQVSDRNHSTFLDRVRFDNTYLRDISFVTDAKVLLQTVRAVIRCTGY